MTNGEILMEHKKVKNKLTKAGVLRKFVETLGLKLEKVSPLTPEGGICWELVRDHGNSIYRLNAPNCIEICALGPRTDILDFLFNDIPCWYEKWPERDSIGRIMKVVEFVNPIFGCRSLEEAMVKLDLLDGNKA